MDVAAPATELPQAVEFVPAGALEPGASISKAALNAPEQSTLISVAGVFGIRRSKGTRAVHSGSTAVVFASSGYRRSDELAAGEAHLAHQIH